MRLISRFHPVPARRRDRGSHSHRADVAADRVGRMWCQASISGAMFGSAPRLRPSALYRLPCGAAGCLRWVAPSVAAGLCACAPSVGVRGGRSADAGERLPLRPAAVAHARVRRVHRSDRAVPLATARHHEGCPPARLGGLAAGAVVPRGRGGGRRDRHCHAASLVPPPRRADDPERGPGVLVRPRVCGARALADPSRGGRPRRRDDRPRRARPRRRGPPCLEQCVVERRADPGHSHAPGSGVRRRGGAAVRPLDGGLPPPVRAFPGPPHPRRSDPGRPDRDPRALSPGRLQHRVRAERRVGRRGLRLRGGDVRGRPLPLSPLRPRAGGPRHDPRADARRHARARCRRSYRRRERSRAAPART